jgi:RNA ligase (TIGR02306 family)
MSFRKLATIRKVLNINEIPGADSIEVAVVDSWNVVVRKGEVTVGSLVVYFEIDSWIPTSLAPFLSKGIPKKYNEIEGEKLRTIKLKGQISQGLIINISEIINLVPDFKSKVPEIIEGLDVSDVLGITKWELVSSIGNFHTKGSFPSFVNKTDQERLQNLTKNLDEIKTSMWEVTEKYDGTSLTAYVCNVGKIDEQEGVCSRNLDLKKEIIEPNGTVSINSYWEIVIRDKLLEKIKESGLNIALQGELIGPKIGPNIYKLTGRNFYLFDIYNIDKGIYFSPEERQKFCEKYDIKHVPVLFNNYEISQETTIKDLLKFAEGKSILNVKTEREGLVFKNIVQKDCSINSFKVISNNYLIKIG